MTLIVSFLLIAGMYSGPTSILAVFFYVLCSLPFFGDMLISLRGAYNSMAGTSEGATVEEIAENQEDFLPADQREEEDGPHREESCMDPSQRILPSFVI